MNTRAQKNVYARLEGILQMIVILEEDFDKRLQQVDINRDGLMLSFEVNADSRIRSLMREHAHIRQLRLDGQRIALQAGEKVAEWYAARNYQMIKATEAKQ